MAGREAPCRIRIFEGTIDARLIALDGKTGKPCGDFGADGQIDLKRGVVYGPEFRGDYEVTSAPTVVGDLVITGSSIADNSAVDMPRGVVRAYDVRTGKLRWTWDPIPWAEKQQVRTGAANAWSTFASDPARDLVFIPTGSASPDYYGGARPGDNKWANSVVALKASTGAFVWGFQVAHHDLWDYDIASQPTLIEFKAKPAVAVTSKIGNVFVLDRLTGKPLMTVEERSVPKSDIPGEDASSSQPIPAWSPMVPQKLTANPNIYFDISLKLRPGVTVAQANAELQPYLEQFAKQSGNYPQSFRVSLRSITEAFAKPFGPVLYLLLGAVSLLLVIGCANVSILLLARGAQRQHEIAVRAAVGADRSRIVTQLLTESLMLALVGAALGVARGTSGEA